MAMDPTISRRAVLAAGAAGAGAAALAACSSGSSSGSGAGTGAPPGKALARLEEIPVGGAKVVKLPGGGPAVVARTSADAAACFSAICTHMGCTVALKGKELECPCHRSRFNPQTGAVLNGPATAPLQKIPVKVSGGEVVTACRQSFSGLLVRRRRGAVRGRGRGPRLGGREQ